MSPQVLAVTNSFGHIALNTATYTVQVGYVLLRLQDDGSVRPIEYCSRSLTDAERTYDMTELESLFIV